MSQPNTSYVQKNKDTANDSQKDQPSTSQPNTSNVQKNTGTAQLKRKKYECQWYNKLVANIYVHMMSSVHPKENKGMSKEKVVEIREKWKSEGKVPTKVVVKIPFLIYSKFKQMLFMMQDCYTFSIYIYCIKFLSLNGNQWF